MATRPTVDDLTTWLGLAPLSPGPSEARTILGSVLDTSLEEIESRLRDGAIPSDVDEYPNRVRMAVLMYGGRLYKRRSSPEGIVDNEFGIVRVGRFDPDIETLIASYVKLDGFA